MQRSLAKKSYMTTQFLLFICKSILLDFNSPSLQTIKGILLDYSVITLITKSEDNKLNRVGLRSKMPQDWDGKNPLARYASVEIEILKIERSF